MIRAIHEYNGCKIEIYNPIQKDGSIGTIMMNLIIP
jgi:hypothetical protein